MRINTVNHFISDAAKSLKRNRTISVTSIITVFMTFFVLGCFVLLADNFNIIIDKLQDKIELKVYLLDNIELIDKREVEVKLRSQEGVQDIAYESREEAFKNAQESTKHNPEILSGFSIDKNNPFPASYTVRLSDPKYADSIIKAVGEMPGVEDISNQKELVETISKVIKGVKVVGFALFAILIGVSIFLIMNTTKLTVYSRRREVGIMKFVGATDWFIRWPFIIEGIIIGVVGAVGATIGLYFLYKFIFGILAAKMIMLEVILPTYVLSSLLWKFALGGIVVGATASIAALRKFLVV